MDEPDEYGPQGEEGLAAYARTWTSEYCLLPPGRAFSYSNSGFALAGLALQEADKKPYADVMRERDARRRSACRARPSGRPRR